LIFQVTLKLIVQAYDGTIFPAAVTVRELDALFGDTVDCVETGFHEIVGVTVSSVTVAGGRE
jgi:hypothetical protein